MKFIVSSSALLKNLQAIGGVLTTNNTLPILDNFLFELKEDLLYISASDLETTITVSVPVTKAEEPGSIAIPAKILVNTLKTFSDIPVTFSIELQKGGIELTAGEGKYNLTGFNSEEYPKVPVLEETASVNIDSGALTNAISKTIFATGNDELRPVMSGIYCILTAEDTMFVATDAHKLVRYKHLKTKSENEASFILPRKPLNLLKNILASESISIKIDYNKTNASFSADNLNMVCRLIDGKYPNYEAVIPKKNPNKLTIERHMFLNSLKRVAIFANQSTYQVRLKISGREMELYAEDLDFSNEAKERLTCQYEGEDIEIGFNSKFLIEMLSNMDSKEVYLEMSAPNRAGILLPVDDDNDEEEILMLVMPVMLNN